MEGENNLTSRVMEKRYVNSSHYVKILTILAILSAFVGHITVYDYFVSTVWVCVALHFVDKEDFWVLFVPLSIFENTIFFYFTNYTIFKIFVLISVMKLFLENKQLTLKCNRFLLIFFMLAAYVVMNLQDVLPGSVSIIICVLTMFMVCFSCYKMQDSEFFRRAMFGFAIFAVAAGVYGVLHGNSRVVSAEGEAMLRFCGTSSDPNIMGYKFVVGFVALWFTDFIKNKVLKFLIAGFLIYVIFRTVSTTAFLALCITFILIVALQEISINKLFIIAFCCVGSLLVIFNLENILLFLAEKEPFGLNVDRLLIQYYSFSLGDYSGATSLRTDIWDGYMDYFFHEQNLFSQLFGGNISNIYGVEKNFAKMSWGAAAHNTNIDILMSVGFVGLFLIYRSSLITLKSNVLDYKRTHDRLSAMRITVKLLTLFYTFSFSAFLSYGFMIFLL